MRVQYFIVFFCPTLYNTFVVNDRSIYRKRERKIKRRGHQLIFARPTIKTYSYNEFRFAVHPRSASIACPGSVGGQVRAQRTTNTHLTAAMLWRHTSWLVGGLLSPPLWNTAATADEYRWCPSIHTQVLVTRKHRLRQNNVANTLAHNSHRPSINWILNKLY